MTLLFKLVVNLVTMLFFPLFAVLGVAKKFLLALAVMVFIPQMYLLQALHEYNTPVMVEQVYEWHTNKNNDHYTFLVKDNQVMSAQESVAILPGKNVNLSTEQLKFVNTLKQNHKINTPVGLTLENAKKLIGDVKMIGNCYVYQLPFQSHLTLLYNTNGRLTGGSGYFISF